MQPNRRALNVQSLCLHCLTSKKTRGRIGGLTDRKSRRTRHGDAFLVPELLITNQAYFLHQQVHSG